MHPTRRRILDEARSLFWRRGYHATGMKEILAAAGAGSGSLYHFFPSKEAVLAEVLRDYLTMLGPMIVDPAFARTTDPVERVFGILGIYRAGLVATSFRYSCPIGRIALEVAPRSGEIDSLIDENFTAWSEVIEGCLEAARDRWPQGTDTGGLARFVLTVMEGAVMQAAAARDIRPFDEAVEHLRSYFALLGGEAPPGSHLPPPQEDR